VGTVWPGTAPPPFAVALFAVAPPPALELPPLLQAASTASAANPIAIVAERLIGRERPLVLFMSPPLKG
jgi:hypothetical protein